MAEQRRQEKFLRDQKAFRENAFNIIEMMLDLCNQTPGGQRLVDEMLHSIFFLGQVNNIRYTPEQIITDEEMLAELTETYPRPLQMFSTQLPKRSPFSCVMDMVVQLERPENEDQIKQRLRDIVRDLKVNKDQTVENLKDIITQLRGRMDVDQIQHSLMDIIRQLEGNVNVDQIQHSLRNIIRQLEGKMNVDQIKKSLMDIVSRLEKWFLMSSTMCVSQPPNSANKYYGVSMSTTGPSPGRIVLAAACLSSNWDDYVAEAVMAYSREKKEKKKGKGKGRDADRDFNGTITLPKDVKCLAFRLSTGGTMKPCNACGELFGLQTDETQGWVYGNCAEAESLSNLLKNEQQVKNQTNRKSLTYRPEKRQKDRESMLQDLKGTLVTVQFKTWDGQFYSPQ